MRKRDYLLVSTITFTALSVYVVNPWYFWSTIFLAWLQFSFWLGMALGGYLREW